ncbi:MAG: selenocysteine-specific translation elongation factor [Acidimicrobiia bacterium]
MPVVATAGHVDHGKSALVQALTGRDPDRWEEEKRRGLTIDLGFAWTTLPSGRVVSFVDVPGHRRFIGNMLVGVGPVTSALFVVGADEGWKPQTEEHLAILDLLDTERIVVALTKIDLVEDLVPVEAQVRARLRGTFAKTAPIVPVSARTGAGLDTLRAEIDDIVVEGKDWGRPYLWVDRAFIISGAGLVVTGTLLDGSLGAGDEVAIWPGEKRARVRAVQSHETKLDRVSAGTRVGINLAGLPKSAVGRGSRLGIPGDLLPTSRIQVMIRTPRYVDELTERGAYQLHVGTAMVAIDLHLLGGEDALIALSTPLWLQAGDRFVIRDSGRQLVVAGGVVLDPAPAGRRRELGRRSNSLVAALRAGPDAVATALLESRGTARRSDLVAWSGGGDPRGLGNGETVLSNTKAAQLSEQAFNAVEKYRAAHPLEKGISVGQLADHLEIDEALTRAVVAQVEGLELRGSSVSVRGSSVDTIDEQWSAVAEQLHTPAPPTLDELGLDRDLLRRLVRDGHLVRVTDNLVYLPSVIDDLVSAVRAIEAPFTVSEFRQLLGITRKHAVPLLEYFDREGITLRSGDLRQSRAV